MNQEDTQLRWWVALPFGNHETPSRRFTLSGESELTEVTSWFSCDRSIFLSPITGEETCVPVSFSALSEFSLRSVIEQIPLLQDLLGFAGSLDDDSANPQRLTEVVGPGPLLESLLSHLGGGGPADSTDLLGGADLPTTQSKASTALDHFVRSTRSSKRNRRSKKTRRLRDLIETAVHLTARRILESPSVSDLEDVWRGLQLLQSQCDGSIEIELLDVTPEAVPELLMAESQHVPDGVFIPTPIADLELLEALAKAGEDTLTPIIVELDPGVFDTDLQELPDVLSGEPNQVPRTEWLALRQQEATRWLCVVANQILVKHEGVGVAARSVLASGVWAIAAWLSKSFVTTGGFSALWGPAHSLKSSDIRVLNSGRHAGTSTPTAAFFPLQAQTHLVKHGITAIGSPRDRPSWVLAGTPMMRATVDASPLPGQIVVGRVVRFSRWVRDQLPADVDSETLTAVFSEAARVFLFPGLGEAATLDATLANDNSIVVHVMVHPTVSGVPIDITFPLSLNSA